MVILTDDTTCRTSTRVTGLKRLFVIATPKVVGALVSHG